MATFLDLGVLGFFGVIFTFLLVFVITYGFLVFIKPFGDKKNGLYAIIAAAFAILSITNDGIRNLISFMAPWYFVVIFVGFFILFILMMFGLKHDQLKAGVSSEFRAWPIIFAIAILLFGLAGSFGQDTLDAGKSETSSNHNYGDENIDDGDIIDTDGDGYVDDPADPGSFGNKGITGDPSQTATDDFGTNASNTLVNPSVLGMILVMLIAAFTMFFLTKSSID